MKLNLLIMFLLFIFSNGFLLATEEKKKEAQAKLPQLLIQAEDLAKKVKKGYKGIIVDCRSSSEFRRGHIPGAVRVDVSNWVQLAHAKGGLTNPKVWAKEVGALGIDGSKEVIVYGGSITSSTRVWWTLKYVGVKNVLFLDGEWPRWKSLKLPTTAKGKAPTAATFKPKFQKDRVAHKEEILKSIKDSSCVMVDTRSKREHSLHIPGSVHLEWKDFLAKDGRFKSVKEIQALFKKHGVKKGKPLVPY